MRKRRKVKYTVALVGDGHTERIYFQDVRDTDRPDDLAIFPEYPRKIGSYHGVLERSMQLMEYYNKVYALIDMDTVIRDNHTNAYTTAKKEAEQAGVIVLENNPCFEMWLLLHFISTGKLFNHCEEVEQMLRHKTRIPNYEKSEKFLAAAGLYRNYKALIERHAIPNAQLLEINRGQQDPLFPRAEIFRFFEWYQGRANP